jgi:hypothetical protein
MNHQFCPETAAFSHSDLETCSDRLKGQNMSPYVDVEIVPICSLCFAEPAEMSTASLLCSNKLHAAVVLE